MRSHRSSASQYTCTDCKKVFSDKLEFTQHVKTHRNAPNSSESPNRKFPCPHCNKTFVLKRLLDHHVNTHTGNKPFKCTSCDKCFAQPGSLHKHQNTHKSDQVSSLAKNSQPTAGQGQGSSQNGPLPANVSQHSSIVPVKSLLSISNAEQLTQPQPNVPRFHFANTLQVRAPHFHQSNNNFPQVFRINSSISSNFSPVNATVQRPNHIFPYNNIPVTK